VEEGRGRKGYVVCCVWNTGFIAYIIVVSIGVLWLVFYASRRWGNSNPLVYITITGTIGSLTVISCKGLGIGLKQTVTGMSQLSNPALYMILVTVAACITIQVDNVRSVVCNYLHQRQLEEVKPRDTVVVSLWLVFTVDFC